MDNATTNDVLARTLARLLLDRYGLKFETQNAQIRCLAHVVNLIVQKILATLEEAEAPEALDYYLLNKFQEFHYDPKDDKELQELESPDTAAADELLCVDIDPDLPSLEPCDDADEDEDQDLIDSVEFSGSESDSSDTEAAGPERPVKSKKGRRKKNKKPTALQKVRKILLPLVPLLICTMHSFAQLCRKL